MSSFDLPPLPNPSEGEPETSLERLREKRKALESGLRDVEAYEGRDGVSLEEIEVEIGRHRNALDLIWKERELIAAQGNDGWEMIQNEFSSSTGEYRIMMLEHLLEEVKLKRVGDMLQRAQKLLIESGDDDTEAHASEEDMRAIDEALDSVRSMLRTAQDYLDEE